MFASSINTDEILALPEFEYEGDIVVVDNVKMLKQLTPDLISEFTWGFDTETKPNFKKGNPNPNRVALIQLSNAHTTYLFRVQKIGLGKILKHILSQENVIKIGVAVKDDILGLKKIERFEPKGFVDLQTESNKYGISDNGLRSLAAIVLGKRISKSQQLSNWENDVLTDKQILYAAIDARACYLIYEIFQNINQHDS